MKAREFIDKSFRSNLFLTTAIGLAIYCGASVLSGLLSLSSDVFSLLVEAALLIAPVMSLIAAFKLYSGTVNSFYIRRLGLFCTFMKILCIILTVLLAILGVAAVLGLSAISNLLLQGGESYE